MLRLTVRLSAEPQALLLRLQPVTTARHASIRLRMLQRVQSIRDAR